MTKKSIHLYRDDQGYYAEWSGDGGRDEGVRRFGDYATAVATVWQWTVDAGGDWRDLADLQKPKSR